jgi:hypothetical protein
VGTKTKIDEYRVMYSANMFPPRIGLMSAGNWIGQLIFYPNGKTLPGDSMVGTQVNLYYHLDDFQNIIDLLRNEKPVYLSWMGAGGENGIDTALEAVGEEEKV